MAGDECAGGGSLWAVLGESAGAGGWRWWWASSGEPATGVRCLSRGEAMCVGGTCAGGATWATLGGRRGELREVITWACPPLTALSRAGAGVGACRVSMARSGQVRSEEDGWVGRGQRTSGQRLYTVSPTRQRPLA